LGRGPLAALFCEDVIQRDVEMGMTNWDLFEVFDKA
jgi:hypothetical protein